MSVSTSQGMVPKVREKFRAWLKARANALVWSFADKVGDGLNCHCNDHGGFDNEADTLASLSHIMKSGF